MEQRLKSHIDTYLTPRFFSAAFLIPISLGLIYIGSPYSLLLGGFIAIGIFIEWALLIFKNQLSFWPRFVCVLLGTAYLSIAVFWFFYYLSMPEGWKFIYVLLFLVWSTDIGAFVGGNLLKGPKLAPSISPHKTWSGFLTGLVSGTMTGYIFAFWLIPGALNIPEAALLAFVAQGGDLLESKAKRWSFVKDTGSLIPGHGGILDRLDSLLAVLCTLALWQALN